MKIYVICNDRIIDSFFLEEDDYYSNVKDNLALRLRHRNLNNEEELFKKIFMDCNLVDAKKIRRLKQILRCFDEVGITNEVFDFLEETSIEKGDFLLFIPSEIEKSFDENSISKLNIAEI